jgi:Fungal N-terminal domain of STAND proteins
MDPLSIATGVLAVLTAAAKLGSSIKDLIDDLNDAPTELIEINDEIASVTDILGQIEALTCRNEISNIPDNKSCTTSRSDSIEADRALNSCLTIITQIEEKITDAQRRLARRRRHVMKITRPFTWKSDKQELRDLRGRLQYSKTVMLMSLQLDILLVYHPYIGMFS